MHTLVDFLTRVKGVEYILSVLTITGFILFLEVLKPAPFRSLRKLIGEDVAHLREEGFRNVMRTVGRMVAGPFIGLLYVVSLPFLFVYTLAVELRGMAAEGMAAALDAVGASAVFGWRPGEAYLAGRKARRKEKKDGKPEPKDGDR
ncbi:MAG: hypothetical protein D4R80_05740 [Deltaproteobacteria bacterium]|nr:MAG: hypothetical protein D4R80_05740 [Deltaproteobacteria bacterium]